MPRPPALRRVTRLTPGDLAAVRLADRRPDPATFARAAGFAVGDIVLASAIHSACAAA